MKVTIPKSIGYLLGLSLLMAACTTVSGPSSQPTSMTPISPTVVATLTVVDTGTETGTITDTIDSPETSPSMTATVTAEETAMPEETAVPSETTTPQAEGDDADSQANELANTRWTLESFGPEGQESLIVGNTPLLIEFSSNGEISGFGGCNSFAGSYRIEGDTLQVSEIVSTLVACVDTALMEQEIQYLDALQTVSQFQVDGDQLTIAYVGEQATPGTLTFARHEDMP